VENDNSTQDLKFLGRLGGRSRWFLAELIVIVAGVLIALAIDQWRGNIDKVNLEQEYLEQLAADLQTTVGEMAAAADINAAAEAAAGQLLAAFENGEPVELETIRQLLSEINTLDDPVPVLGTLEALISTGDLRLMRSSKTRSEITRYLARGRDYWLFPIYQIEQRHRELCFRITTLAEMYGISPSHRGGRFRGQSGPASGPNVAAFLGDSEAYSHAARLVEIKASLARFRSAMSAEAAELLKTLERSPPSE
jgi:hypothetical protein